MMGRVAEGRQENQENTADGGANGPAPREDAAPAEGPAERPSDGTEPPSDGLAERLSELSSGDLEQPPSTELAERPSSALSDGSAAPGSEPVDEEQLRQFRQFQEFQRFLEYQREHGEGPDERSREAGPAGWRRTPPAWLTKLGGKLLTAFLVLIAVVAGLALAINHYLGGSDEVSDAELAEQGGKKAEETKLYASDPYEAVRDVYRRVAQQDPSTGLPQVEKVCLRFDEAGRSQFTANMGAPTCEDAVIALNEDVEHVTNYVQSLPRSMPYEVYDEVSQLNEGESYTIESCEAARSLGGTIIGGPALGTFIVSKIPDAKGEQWLITGHEPGPRSCPTPTRTMTN